MTDALDEQRQIFERVERIQRDRAERQVNVPGETVAGKM